MRREIRYENGDNFVEIEQGISENEGHVWFIKSNISFKNLPVEFRARLLNSDEQGFEKLEMALSSWAARNGYACVSE